MSTPGPSANGTHRQSNDNFRGKGSTRIAAVFVVMVMAASCLVLVNGSDDSFALSGDLGDVESGVGFYLDTSDGELDITFTSGTGITYDFNMTDKKVPWDEYRDDVKKVVVYNGVVQMGNNLLSDLPNLETVQFGMNSNPVMLTAIGNSCFKNDTKLTSITLPSNLTTIGSNAFEGCGIMDITMPAGVTVIPGYCFLNCKSLSSVTLSESTTQIRAGAFKGSTLSYLMMPDTITEIQADGFFNCKSLQTMHVSGNLSTLGGDAFYGNSFCDSEMTPMGATKENLKGKTFERAGEYLAEIVDPLVHDGSDCSITEDSTSVTIHASSIAFVVDKANSEASTTFKVNLSEGRVASFDCNAIKTFATATATLRMDPMHPESIDEKTKELIGDQPVFIISFGDNTSFGDGKMTITLPYTLPEGESADELKVYCIDGGEIVEKYDCTYADGKVTFSTGHLSTYSFGFESPSSGGKFPVWAIVLIVIVLLAAAGGAAAFFVIKNKKNGPSSDVSEPAAPVVNDASGSYSEEAKETMVEEPPAPVAEPVEETPKEEEPAPAEEKAEAPKEDVAEAPAKEEIPAPVAEPVVEEAPIVEAEPEPAEQKTEAPKEEPVAEAPAAVPVVEEAPAAPVAEAEPEEKAPIETPAPAEEPVAEAPSEYVPAPEIKKESEPSPEKEEPATATEEKPKKRRPVSNMDDDDLDPSGSEDW